jgi:hypothetical protein
MAAPTAQSPAYQLLTWWSRADLAGLGDRVGAALRRWSLDWGVPVGDVRACNACELPAREFGLAQWRPMPDLSAGPAWIASTAEDLPALVERQLFGASDPAATTAAGSLASEVAAAAAQALRVSLADALQTTTVQHHSSAAVDSRTSPPMRDSRPWSGAVCIFARIGTGQSEGVWLHLSPDCATALCADSKTLRCREPRAAYLTPLDEAIVGVPLRLRFELDAVQLDLGSLQALQLGDVISLPHRLDQPMHAHIGQHPANARARDSKPMCHAYLGMRQGRRAVELVRSDKISQ